MEETESWEVVYKE